MRSFFLFVIAGLNSVALANAGTTNGESKVHATGGVPNADEVKVAINDVHVAQDPLMMDAMSSSDSSGSPRHRQEKAHLQKRMDKKSDKWGISHPRYRLLEALWAYTRYRERHMAELDRWRSLYKSVGKKQRKTLEKAVGYTKKLDEIQGLIEVNAAVSRSIACHAMEFYSVDQTELDEHVKQAEKDKRQADRFATAQTLKHYVRDWADEGVKERNEAFPCILSTLRDIRAESPEGASIKVLLPGSGVGRIGHDVANLGGFEVTINEWSMFMNAGYRYIEAQKNANAVTIHPFIDAMSHHATKADIMRSVTVPNIKPNPSVLLVEGDFNTAFKDRPGHYDIVVTHFFIDTARNLMAYFDTIHRLLKPGGKWINFGPLLYGTGPFVQLSLEEIMDVVEEMGFKFEDLGDECGELTFEGKKIRSKEAEYGFNRKALTRHAYLAQVWMVRKA
ncbi:carnosine N-methyltransferase [Alternaria panax]|uniref:Carnosine N-methyltransferase n=1 Tax=Alternaria panax TaxID=48097 RepID=A0AAD4I9J5_9PLEO|nr:carnosine N-methyltransferase [Alternaria panax]